VKADAVFSGGGMKALAFAGALKAAEEAGYDDWQKLAGTSAGAITATALAVGYDAERLRAFLAGVDLGAIADYGNPRRVGQLVNLLTLKGLARGRALRAMIRRLLAEAPEPARTFGELRRELHVIGTDLVHRRMVVFPRDAALYLDPSGAPWRPEEFPIVEAVRISAGYPYMFPPVTLRHAGTGAHALLVDGGVTSPYPVGIFDIAEPCHPTWGFRLDDRRPDGGDASDQSHPIAGGIWPVSLMLSLLGTSLNSLNELELAEHVERTIAIPTGNVPTLAFALSRAQQDDLFATGYGTAREFFAGRPQARNAFGAAPPSHALP
jgi:NTE family protein